MSYGPKMLTTAFVSGHNGPMTKDIDLRNETFETRLALKGKKIPVVIYNQHVNDIPEPLLKVTSIYAAEFIKNGQVILPEPVDVTWPDLMISATNILVDYIKSLTQVKKAGRLQLQDDDDNMETYLGLCIAGKLLGMEKYIDHIFRKVDAIVHGLPSYEDLDALIKLADLHHRFYNATVQTFARMVRNGEIPDADEFNAYLEERSKFAQDIAAANIQYGDRVRDQAQREERVRQRVEIEEAAKLNAIELKKQEKERRAHEQQYWDAKKTNDTKLRKSTDEKMHASGKARKFTSEERTWYVKAQGKQPPKGC